MQLGMLGLGRMGANMMHRLKKNGHECVVFDQDADVVKQFADKGAIGASGMDDFIQHADFCGRVSDSGEASFGDKLLSAMRFQFGGHHEKPGDGS